MLVNKGRLVRTLTCVEALCDGGGIDEEPATKGAVDVGVELVEGEFGLNNKRAKNEIIDFFLICNNVSKSLMT